LPCPHSPSNSTVASARIRKLSTRTLETEILNKLTEIAKERGINVQELIRAVIIPEWLRDRKNRFPPERKTQLLREKE
jgi:predicted DNA-binding ribbon-helix-helix protein